MNCFKPEIKLKAFKILFHIPQKCTASAIQRLHTKPLNF